MKRIFITERQSRILKENGGSEQTHFFLENRRYFERLGSLLSIDREKMEKLALKGFSIAKSEFNDDIASYEVSKIKKELDRLIVKCLRKEEKIKPQLENICRETLNGMFEFPEDLVDFECHLVQEINPKKNFRIKSNLGDEEEYDDYSQIDSEEKEISKRKFLNTLIIGSAMNLFWTAYHECIGKVFELDEELPHLYSRIVKINSYLLYADSPEIVDENHQQSGYVNVRVSTGNNSHEIVSEAILFPFLLTESIRGFMELFASHGLPDDRKMAEKIIEKSDLLKDEPYNMCVGPVLWGAITNIIGELDTKDIPSFFYKFASIPAEDFLYFLKEIYHHTKKGKEDLKLLFDASKKDTEYGSFETDIEKKQGDTQMITDGYYTPEELIDETGIWH